MLTLWILLNKQLYKNRNEIKELLYNLYQKIKPYLTWHFLLCFGIAWMITNGWGYLFIIFGETFNITWMARVGWSYIIFLFMPFTPEKVVTIPIAVWLVRKMFPNDFHTIKLLNKIKDKENGKKEVA